MLPQANNPLSESSIIIANDTRMTQLAIIGAGMAGLAAARALQQRRPALAITVYEKSRGLGGRVATRRRDGFSFDHGAQNVRAPTPALHHLLTTELPCAQLHDIGLPVWVFDGAGALAAGDQALNAEPKWVYRDGMNRLGKLLAAGIPVRHEVQVGQVNELPKPAGGQAQWALFDRAGVALGIADAVLFTPPGPQAADLIVASALNDDLRQALLAELAPVRYRRCISLALAYPQRVERPYYALLNIDRTHPITWLALEHSKAPERCPPGTSLLIAQMAPGWSSEHWETAPAELERLIAPPVAALLAADLGAPLWSDVQRWRYALPDAGADFATLNATRSGLFFAGDYTAGLGRVHLAIESGWRVAEAIEQWLDA